MDSERLIALIQLYRLGNLTPGEADELFAFLEEDRGGVVALPVLESLLVAAGTDGERSREDTDLTRWQPILEQILAADKPIVQQQEKRPALIFGMRRWLAAVAAAAILIFLVWQFNQGNLPNPSNQGLIKVHDVAPGGNKAILTLSGGQQIILDSAHNGQLASQGSTRIIKTDSGSLSYHSIPKSPNQQSAILYNTLTTPRGGQYQLTLPDGTRVWLNAASSITYPTAFIGTERKVEITGEAYFEVAKNTRQPFSVVEKGIYIEVLGTHFNVNGYDDETFSNTTLLEGAVKVSYQKVGALLRPGMQAQVYRGPNPDSQVPAIKVGPANVEQAVAWKNGLFSFAKADLPTVLRQLSRWYDVDVKYEGRMPLRSFNGEIGKSLTLDQLLKVLTTTTRVHYKIEGKQLTIQP